MKGGGPRPFCSLTTQTPQILTSITLDPEPCGSEKERQRGGERKRTG